MSIRFVFVITCGIVSLISSVSLIGLFLLNGMMVGSHTQSFLYTLTALVAAALLLISLWIGYLVVQPLRRRLFDIEEAASLIANGRLHHRIQTMGDTDEIGQLASQFNVMGDRIQEQVGLLQRMAEQNRLLQAESERAAALDERQRLSRDLHDTVSQQLFAMTMLTAAAERYHQQDAPQLTQTLAQLKELSQSAQREMRALLLHLRPVELEGRRFDDAALDFLRAVEGRHQLRFEFLMNYDVALTQSVEEHLFRILQEAVANVLKHANASGVRVELTADAGHIVRMIVLDDGVGIDEEVIEGVNISYGLRAMKERAAALGGQCQVWKRDKGTAVEVRIPLVEVEK